MSHRVWLSVCLVALGLGCARPARLPPPTPVASPTVAGPASSAPIIATTLTPELAPPEAVLFLPVVLAQAPPRLLIPALGLDVTVVAVPIRDGRWTLDSLGQSVGWLATTGEVPAEGLAPVLVGHVSLPNGTSGPFGYLWRLKPGAEIAYVWQGQRYNYQVESKRTLEHDEIDAIYVPDGQRLLLVTCYGWDVSRWAYTQRLVVEATLTGQAAMP